MSPEVKCEHTEIVDPAILKDHPRNANRHPESQIKALAANISQFGWRHPVVVSKLSGRIVMGHGRRDAALRLECLVPVDYQDFQDEEEELAVLVSDNVIPELAEMDAELLEANRDLIDAAGFDLEIIGFDMGEEIDETDAPDLPEGDRAPFQQMVFTLHDAQVETVKKALEIVQKAGNDSHDLNKNKNGNALAWICEQYVEG